MRVAVALLSLAVLLFGLAMSPAWWLAPITAGAAGLAWSLLSDDGKGDQ